MLRRAVVRVLVARRRPDREPERVDVMVEPLERWFRF